MLIFSDEEVRPSARMHFAGILDFPTCSKLPFAFKWVVLEVSKCKSFPDVFPGR